MTCSEHFCFPAAYIVDFEEGIEFILAARPNLALSAANNR
jgi:hypothetical protein